MGKKRKLSLFIVSLVLLVLLGYYWHNNSNKITKINNPDSFIQVFSGDLIDSISVVGKTNIMNEQKLKFNQGGTVKSIYVQVGQQVKQGELLAQLDNSEILNEISDAQIKLENSQIELNKIIDRTNNIDKIRALNNLENLEKKSSDLQIELQDLKNDHQEQIENKLNEISDSQILLVNQKTEFELAMKELDTNLILKQKELEDKSNSLNTDNSNLDLEITRINKDLQNKISMYYKDLENIYYSLKDDSSDIEQSLRTINGLLRKDSDYDTIEFNYYFSFKNPDYKYQSENFYFETKQKLSMLNNCIDKINESDIKLDSLKECLNIENLLYKTFYQLGDYTCKGLDYSSQGEEFTQDTISSYKSTCTTIKSNSFTKQSTVLDLIIKISDLESPLKLQENAKIQIETKKQEHIVSSTSFDRQKQELFQYEKSIGTKKSQLEIDLNKSIKDLEKLQNSYNKLLKDHKLSVDAKLNDIKNHSLDLQLARKDFDKFQDNEEEKLALNNIKQNEINLEQVKKKLESYELRAPFDGLINFVDIKVGDNLVSDNQSSINIVNPNVIEVRIQLDQIDVVKVNKGQEATIIFDAYPGEVFIGKLGDIDSKPKEDYGTTKYEVSVYLEKGSQEQKIYSGMSAGVEIVLDKVQGVVMVPTMSLEMDDVSGMNYVTKLQNGVKYKQFVQVGMASNGNTEILSGLSIGDKILEINFDSNKFQSQDFNSFGGIGY